MNRKKPAHFSPGRVVLYSLFLAIGFGTALLALPWARTTPISLLDLFFTATSALCVTGLFTVPLDQFTLFGHGILLLLIQIGGLGLMTITSLVMYLIIDVGFATKVKAGKLLEIESWQSLGNLIKTAFFVTIIAELIGVILAFPVFLPHMSSGKALFYALFHSISSFCNAGIILPPYELTAMYQQSYLMLITTSLLMLAGGIGFLTWHEGMYALSCFYRKKRHSLSLQTKIILYGTSSIIILSTTLFWIIERLQSFQHFNTPLTLIHAFFCSISAKSAGLFFLPSQELHAATILLILILAFIGSSPASTGSGIKITTFAIFIATVKAAITGRSSVEIFERCIEQNQVYKAIAVVALGISWIVCATVCLLITEVTISSSPGGTFALIVESISSFTTVGISLGITDQLSLLGKCILLINMIAGRIGSLTLILGLKFRTQKGDTAFSYPKEQVMLS